MESPSLAPSKSVRPVAPYIGGKRALAKRLVERINATPHTLYAEPFVGMGGVFLRRDHRPDAEIINDWSQDVVTLFRILQRHYQSFLEELKWRLSSRAEFDRLMKQDPDTLTDLERAARFLYLQRSAFGGKVSGRNFAMLRDRPARFDLTKVVPLLEDVHDRLAGVTIERLPFGDFIAKYDTPGTLFYLDPPYWGCESDYGTGLFAREDFARLADQLASIKGRFILSINDRPEVRELFGGFTLEPVGLFYRVSGKPTDAAELIVSN